MHSVYYLYIFVMFFLHFASHIYIYTSTLFLNLISKIVHSIDNTLKNISNENVGGKGYIPINGFNPASCLFLSQVRTCTTTS